MHFRTADVTVSQMRKGRDYMKEFFRSDGFKKFSKWSGIICCVISVLILATFFLAPRYQATITEASEMFVTHRATRSNDPNWKNVSNRYVTVEYKNGTASNIHIRRQPNEKMPGVGDTITICSFPWFREFDPARMFVGIAATAVYGIAMLMHGLGKDKGSRA